MIEIPTLQGKSSEKKRQEIKTYFQKADPLRHPIIFYYGHTATFFINKLKLAKITDERIDPRLESVFAVGVDEISWDDLATQKSRYGLKKHFYQHAGFRYIESNHEEKIMTNSYTTDSIVSQYCHFAWGENHLGVENYPAVCAKLALSYVIQETARKYQYTNSTDDSMTKNDYD
jgi:hypothetical protein